MNIIFAGIAYANVLAFGALFTLRAISSTPANPDYMGLFIVATLFGAWVGANAYGAGDEK